MFKNFNDYKLNRKKIEFLKLNDNDNNYKQCSIAIIIPHRNRIDHLKKFISHVESMKDIQGNNKMDIFIIDQDNADKFNRGLLLNIGYIIAKKYYSYDRYIFHDVDSYPDRDLFKLYFKFIDYNIHFASPELGYKYTHDKFLGGVCGFCKSDYEKVNGFPNNFFGWGSEDDAFYNRCAKFDIKIYRPTKGSYILEEHEGPTNNEKNDKRVNNILEDLKNFQNNGVKQILDLFINIKKYDINDFINNYKLINNLDSDIQTYINSKVNNDIYNVFKIDYLATHNINSDSLLSKDFINNKIKKKLELFGNEKYYQHPKHIEIISYLKPLINMSEIENEIFNTFTNPKPFSNDDIKNENIKEIVDNSFKHFNKNLTKEDLFKTITFLFETFNELLYFRIRNNKLESSYHLYNYNNKIDWMKHVKTIAKNGYKSIDEDLIDIMNSQGKTYYTLRKPHFIPADNCKINFDSYEYFNDINQNIKNINDMINLTIKNFKIIPDSDILINIKEFPLINKDNKIAYTHLLNNELSKITTINNFFPFGSKSVNNNSMDIPIPINNIFIKTKKIKWENKKPIIFFRGDLTDCGLKIDNNQILHIADLSLKNNNIDAKITNINNTVRIYNQLIGTININKYEDFIDKNSKNPNEYKYNLNIYNSSLNFNNSLILKVESEYKLWYEPLLKDNENIISIKSDYSNLSDKIKWLDNNDILVKKIAKKGYKFTKKYLNEKMISTFWFYYMININHKNHSSF